MDEERIRPSVWLFAGACCLGAGFLLFLAARATDAPPPGPIGAQTDDATHPVGPFSPAERGASPGVRWEPALGEPGALPPFAPATAADVHDPQMAAMERWIGPRDGGVIPHFAPTYAEGRLVSIAGDLPIPAGTDCEVRVLPVMTAGFTCLVRVVCGDVVLYPDASQNAGYVACELREGRYLSGSDEGVTSADGDPTVSLDTNGGRIVISDGGPGAIAFRAEVELTRPRFL